jgi:hypothetical protein
MVTVVKILRIFRRHFNTARHGRVSCRNTIQLWVENFRMSASTLKNEPPGGVRTARSPQNIEAVRQSFIWSPRRSAKRSFVALEMPDRNVKGILHKDLNFPLYKMAVLQTVARYLSV